MTASICMQVYMCVCVCVFVSVCKIVCVCHYLHDGFHQYARAVILWCNARREKFLSVKNASTKTLQISHFLRVETRFVPSNFFYPVFVACTFVILCSCYTLPAASFPLVLPSHYITAYTHAFRMMKSSSKLPHPQVANDKLKIEA
jgi:hypothetical protein